MLYTDISETTNNLTPFMLLLRLWLRDYYTHFSQQTFACLRVTDGRTDGRAVYTYTSRYSWLSATNGIWKWKLDWVPHIVSASGPALLGEANQLGRWFTLSSSMYSVPAAAVSSISSGTGPVLPVQGVLPGLPHRFAYTCCKDVVIRKKQRTQSLLPAT